MKTKSGKIHTIGRLKISRAAWYSGGVILLILLLISVFPQSNAVAILENPIASVNGSSVNIDFDVSGAPEDGIEATLIVVKKTESTSIEPPADSKDILNAIRFDPQSVTNGENSLVIPIDDSLHGTALRIYIVGSDGTDPVFVDVDGVFTDNEPGTIDSESEETALKEIATVEPMGNESLTEEIVPLADVTSSGVTVSGKVKSYDPQNAATICLMKGVVEVDRFITNTTVSSGQITQDFQFNGVQPGKYSLIITKAVHTKFTLSNIVVGEDNVDLTQNDLPEISVMTLRCGDINNDGLINDGDLTILWHLGNFNKSVGDANDPLCDINGDGMINDGDLTILWLIYNYNKEAVVIDLAGNPNTKYTVTFTDWDGSVLDTQQVVFGSNAALPGIPTRKGYIFAGWNGDYRDVSEDQIITARYISESAPNIFTVLSTTGMPGAEVTVKLRLNGQINVVSFNLLLSYDTDVLRFVRNSGGMRPVVNGETVPGMVQIGYAGAQNEEEPTDVVNIVFKIKETAAVTDTALTVNCSSAFYIDSQGLKADAPFETANGVVFVR